MNEQALGSKLNDHLKYVFHYLRKMGASQEDAEDIIQEAAYRFLLYIDAVEPGKAESWLFRVAINLYYDLTRNRNRRQKIFLNFKQEDLFDNFTPEKALLKQDLSKEILQTLDSLKPIHRQLLIMKYSMELSYQDIARLLDISLSSVKAHLFRARQRFIEEYRRLEYEPN